MNSQQLKTLMNQYLQAEQKALALANQHHGSAMAIQKCIEQIDSDNEPPTTEVVEPEETPDEDN